MLGLSSTCERDSRVKLGKADMLGAAVIKKLGIQAMLVATKAYIS